MKHYLLFFEKELIMQFNIESTESPSSSDIDLLTRKINEESSEFGQASPFAFYIRDENNQIIAGANGFLIYGIVYTDQLWVDKLYRNQGLARKIMNKVHAFGLLKECKTAGVQTMSFQNAVQFYKKLGYQQDFQRQGYTKDSSCIFMIKHLECH